MNLPEHLTKIAIVACLPLLWLTTNARAQSALDGFDPNANGAIRVVVIQPDGKILLGGDFTTLAPNGGAPVTRNHVARLNPDGTLDTGFDPNVSGQVYCIALQSNNQIVVGGLFANLSPNGGGTVGRNNIARLNVDGTVDGAFDPNANGLVYSVAVQGDGQVLAGGLFSTIGGEARNFIARLDAKTGAADSFNPKADSNVSVIKLQPDNKILLGGSFTSIGGQPRSHIARLDPVSGLADAFDPDANGAVFSIALQADGKILACGQFMNIGGQPRNRIARLDSVTGLADSYNAMADNNVFSVVVQPDGKILVAGSFTTIGPTDFVNGQFGQPRNYIARLDPTTGLADEFNPSASDLVMTVAVQPDGKVVAGGLFDSVAPNGGSALTRNHIARLEVDGRADRTLNLNLTGSVLTTAIQSDGKILIGGEFTDVLGAARNHIARLNSDGTLDTTFDPNADFTVLVITIQRDGKILVGGEFFSIGGESRNKIARLDPITGLADSFDPSADSAIYAIALQADGKILVGGNFVQIGGGMRSGLARLDANTGLVDVFNAHVNGGVSTMVVQPDGKILVGGGFDSIGGAVRHSMARLDGGTGSADTFNPDANMGVTAIVVGADGKILVCGFFNGASSIGGQTRNYIARLDSVTGLADEWDPNANAPVGTIAVQSDGKILAGGYFNGASSIGGQARNRIARLDPATGLADSFNPNVTGKGVYSIALLQDGKILANGPFTAIGGQARTAFARLTNDTGAPQALSVAQNSIIWTRGGSSSLLARVTFESSSDNVTYNPLGNGAASGGDWVLAGLSLAPAQNIYVRARGYYRGSGFPGHGESVTESVRYGVPGSPAPTPTPGPTPMPTGTPGACSWSADTPLPIAVQGEALTSLGGNLYSFAGFSFGSVIATSYKFDGTTWSEVAPLPVALTGARAVTDGNKIYILGGAVSESMPLNTVYRYDPITNSYETMAPFVHEAKFAGAVYLGGKIYKFCGDFFTGFPQSGLEIYDIATNIWVVGANYPSGKSNLSAFAQGNFIYGLGGVDSFNGPTAKTYRYDPATDTWDDAAIADLPTTRYGAASAFYNNGGVLAGGSAPGTNGTSVIVWDPGSNTWSNLPDMLVPSSGSAAVLGGSMYVIGGGTNDNQRLTCPLNPTPTPGPTASPPPGPTPTPTASASPTPGFYPTSLGNISTRLQVGTGSNVLIGGFIITGSQPKKVIVRAIGPSLTSVFPDALANPVLELRDSSGALIMSNDNWRSNQEQEIIDSGVQPSNDLESAIVATLSANGSAYTAIVRGLGDGTGVAVVEAYDLDQTVDSRLADISTRGLVQAGDNVLIAGTIAVGPGSKRVIVRAIGPSLPVDGKLADPTLELRDGNGNLIRANDNWRSDQEQEIINTGIPPTDDLESAILETLPAEGAAYTAIVRGVNDTTGVALVEVYALSN